MLQAKPYRALIFLYDLADTRLLLTVLVDRRFLENCFRTEKTPFIWRSLDWGEAGLNDSSMVCSLCKYDKECGWFFHQKQNIYFLCASCFQGN